MTHPADRLAFDRTMVTQPVWNDLVTGGEAFALAENVLLHAGPPFTDIDDVPAPVMNSSTVAAVYEGLAKDFDTAEAMIRAGEITLQPAQDHSVVVPLAAVISASMPLHAVYDAWRGKLRTFAPINGGVGPSLRLGLRDTAVLDHIRWLNTEVRDALAGGIGEGIGLVHLAAEGLRSGDDCHGYTPVAGAALVRELRSRGTAGSEQVAIFLDASPSLFLNLWMAATKCLVRAAEGVEGSGLITAAGGNGREVGIQIASQPGTWFTAPANPPEGGLGNHPQTRALGAIGDSALVDCYGLGAMAFANAPKQREVMVAFLPPDLDALCSDLTLGTHPYFADMKQRFGLSVRDMNHQTLVISLGIIDCDGTAGRLGGGIASLPLAAVEKARETLGNL